MKTWISEDTGPDMTIDAVMSVIAYFRILPARAKETWANSPGPWTIGERPGAALACPVTSLRLSSMPSSSRKLL
jgi:serine/threonine-protein kinase HipA